MWMRGLGASERRRWVSEESKNLSFYSSADAGHKAMAKKEVYKDNQRLSCLGE
jgi:hypothetical protein